MILPQCLFRHSAVLTGIHLWVLGQADVSWAEKPSTERSHLEYEIYMKDCIILWGRGNSYSCVACHRSCCKDFMAIK